MYASSRYPLKIIFIVTTSFLLQETGTKLHSRIRRRNDKQRERERKRERGRERGREREIERACVNYIVHSRGGGMEAPTIGK
jgi:hypothetical protein